MDCSLGGEEVYAVVEQKKKKAKMTNKDQELPDGWEIVNDNDRTYYWHVPTGATQWERPSANSTHEMAQQSAEDQPPPIPMRTNEASVLLEAVQSSATDTDVDGHVGLASRLQELKTADMRYSSLNIGGSSPKAKRRQLNTTAQLADGVQTFPAVSVGYVELEETQLLNVKGGATVSDAIRYITQGMTVSKEGDPVVTGQLWGQVSTKILSSYCK
jgi:amyloid beta (A4) precursor protein-binding family B protein 2 (Fe65-like)